LRSLDNGTRQDLVDRKMKLERKHQNTLDEWGKAKTANNSGMTLGFMRSFGREHGGD
jgi:hypothetical protein